MVSTHLAPDFTIKPSKIANAGKGVFSVRKEPFEIHDLLIKYGDVIMSSNELDARNRGCPECKVLLDDDDEKASKTSSSLCNNCNRSMDMAHDLVAISTPFDLSGYINHSSDPEVINMEKVL
jgi:hypothetical protein